MSSPSSASSSSSGSSTRSSPVHAASLVDPATHSPALMELIDIKLSRPVIEYVVDVVADTPRGRTPTRPRPAKFTTFVSTVLCRAEVTAPTVLAALVYVARAKPHLHIALEEWALERVFLGALITASKYLNDSTLKNVHWALCTGVFGKRDVGRIEREFLDVLDWELAVSEADLLAHHAGLAEVAFPHRVAHSHSHSTHLAPPQHTHTHTHRRRPSAGAGALVPDLEPSSPQSSAASMSPRTPYSHSHHSSSSLSSSSTMDVDVDVDMDEDADMHAPPAPATKPKSTASKMHDLLRAFPLPLPMHARAHAHAHGRGFPMRVAAAA
ncbi:hypothetical protein B0H10DRAFT_2162698 [Mycena sp. CBHHK59/15]|nr:hypothetical protein B0H10DRAFT_2162698 [Mycena sp. CBHHK59/15]